MARFRDVLFTRNFFALWSGQIISEFGDRLNQMALIALVYQKSPGSVMAMAKLFFFVVVPVFVIGPVAGVYVDRWDRKKVMVISDLLRGLLVLAVPVFVYLDMMVPIYILVFLVFSAQRFFLPSKLALIPAIVSEDKLVVANSLSNTTRMIATILGFALAGLIVNAIGHMWGFYLDAISYLISAVLISVIAVPKRKWHKMTDELNKAGTIVSRSIRKNIWQEILEGFRHMVKRDSMKVVTGTLFLLMAGAGSVFCIIIVFIQSSFGTVTQDLGIFGVFLGVGLFAGTVLYGKIGQKLSSIRSIFACFSLSGLALGLFALYASSSPRLFLGGLLVLLLGGVSAPILTCNNTLIHKLVPDNVRGRIFSSMEAVMHLAFLVFMLLTAVMADYFSNLSILLTSGVIFALVGLAGFVITGIKGTEY
ncbi:MAG: MFS transporter [Candidatus Omnitrophica bacterium]|nr:MFS transporter [Candidatus Omnitrophota bacterium]